jgi:hypothetical protein
VSLGLQAGEPSSSVLENTILSTSLSKGDCFLQLPGLSTIQVDGQGIFISIPSTTGSNTGSSSTSSGSAPSLNTSRRGLRLPASRNMSAVCVQPCALLLKVPIVQQTQDSDSGTTAGATAEEEEERMRRFLASSIRAIPWTFEGHSLSPAAYLSTSSTTNTSTNAIELAEADSVSFANTVCSLTEFISSVPDQCSHLFICLSCADRESRDLLACAIKILACEGTGLGTKYERKKLLPWLGSEEEEANESVQTGGAVDGGNSGDSSSSVGNVEQDLRRRLRACESENQALKRERNDLTDQLLHCREELVLLNNKKPSGSSAHSNGDGDASNNTVDIIANNMLGEDVDGVNAEESRTVRMQLISLENKVGYLSKREVRNDDLYCM